MTERDFSASWQALVRLGRVWFAGAIAYLLLQVPDIIGVIDWTKFGDAGPMWLSIATLLLTGLLNFLGKLVREPTVPVSLAKAALRADSGTSLKAVAASTEKNAGDKVPV